MTNFNKSDWIQKRQIAFPKRKGEEGTVTLSEAWTRFLETSKAKKENMDIRKGLNESGGDVDQQHDRPSLWRKM